MSSSMPVPACHADYDNQSAWQGQGILVGHIDSGIEASLPVFRGAVRDARVFDFYGFYDKDAVVGDASGHGTMTAGLLVGRATSDWPGGTAREAEILVAAAIETGHRVCRILSALMWMLDEPVRIVNLSVGFPGWNPILRPAIRSLVEKGVLVVAAIGNGGAGRYHSPGAYPEVLSVGAAGDEGRAAAFSGSLNNNLLCIKPDVLGLCTMPFVSRDGRIVSKNTGTSGATAVVSGVAARLMSQFPHATSRQVAEALKTTTLPLAPGQRHRSCSGLIRPVAAARVLEHFPDPESEVFDRLEFFRDEELYRRIQYISPENYIPVILYAAGIADLEDYIYRTMLRPGAIRSVFVYEQSGYAIANVLKNQLEYWWDNQDILMISGVS